MTQLNEVATMPSTLNNPPAFPAMPEDQPIVSLFFSRAQAARLLGICTRSLDRHISAGLLPYNRLGGKVLFLKDELVAAVKSSRIATREEIFR